MNLAKIAIYTALSAGLFAWYWSRGARFYRLMIATASSLDDFEVIIGAEGISPWMVFGKVMIITTWPVWMGYARLCAHRQLAPVP